MTVGAAPMPWQKSAPNGEGHKDFHWSHTVKPLEEPMSPVTAMVKRNTWNQPTVLRHTVSLKEAMGRVQSPSEDSSSRPPSASGLRPSTPSNGRTDLRRKSTTDLHRIKHTEAGVSSLGVVAGMVITEKKELTRDDMEKRNQEAVKLFKKAKEANHGHQQDLDDKVIELAKVKRTDSKESTPVRFPQDLEDKVIDMAKAVRTDSKSLSQDSKDKVIDMSKAGRTDSKHSHSSQDKVMDLSKAVRADSKHSHSSQAERVWKETESRFESVEQELPKLDLSPAVRLTSKDRTLLRYNTYSDPSSAADDAGDETPSKCTLKRRQSFMEQFGYGVKPQSQKEEDKVKIHVQTERLTPGFMNISVGNGSLLKRLGSKEFPSQ